MKKLALVGSNLRTQGNAPFDDPEFQIWTLNEAPAGAGIKRYDVVFQLHPRWDWERTNNLSDPNHALFLKAIDGLCVYCKGAGAANGVACPHCHASGSYRVPDHRAGKAIVMQDQNADVPGCVRLPIEDMTRRLCADGEPYFTSTFAHMLAFALYIGARDIKIYGFEMESGTEYEHQRACAEYWVGYGRALGARIEAPAAHILRGEHYAYGSSRQGERTRLELRKNHLHLQLRRAELQAQEAQGAFDAIAPFKSLPEIGTVYDQRFEDHFLKKNFVSFLRGAIKGIESSIAIHDAYYSDGADQPGQIDNLIGTEYVLG